MKNYAHQPAGLCCSLSMADLEKQIKWKKGEEETVFCHQTGWIEFWIWYMLKYIQFQGRAITFLKNCMCRSQGLWGST